MGTVMTELGARPEPPASRGRLVMAAVLLAMSLLATVFVGLAAWGATRDLADVREDLDTMAGPALASDLVTGLQDERNYAASYILGFENALELPVDSMDEATGATDDALAALRSRVELRGGDLAAAYGEVLGRIDGSLAGLRQTVDGISGERGQNLASVSEPLYAGYSTLIDDLMDAGDSMALAIDDSELSRGVRLHQLALAQPALVGYIQRGLVLAGVGPGGSVDTAEEVASISAYRAELEANETEIESLATGMYADAAGNRQHAAALSDYLDVVDSSIQGGVVPITEVLTATSANGELSQHYAAMSDAVKRTLAERADDLEQEARSRRLLWFVLAGASLAAVAAALVVVLVR
jgi:hypothetical protein